MEEETFITKKVTHKDVYDELLSQRDIQHAILEQAKKTNGRVTKLEKRSIGAWIGNHPFKFVSGAVTIIAVLVSDSREIAIDIIKSLI